MARNRFNPTDSPPAAASGEEEEEEEEEVVEEEEEEDEELPNANPDGSESEEKEPLEVEEDEEEEEEDEEEDEEEEEKIHPQPSKPDPQEEEEDDETESDSDPDPNPRFTTKEHSKPKEDLSSVPISTKRPADANLSKSNAKKPKSENGGGRLWTDADEIAILQGMIDFQQDRKVDPNSDSIAFHSFVKDTLSVESSKNQVMDKIRRLKKKYRINAAKSQDGRDPVFSRPHELNAFHLSKQIWGGESAPKKTPPSKKNRNPPTEISDNHRINEVATVKKPLVQPCDANAGSFSELYPFLNLSLTNMIPKDLTGAMASSLKDVDKSELEVLEKDWKEQILAEYELTSKRTILLQKQYKLIRDCNN